MALQGAVHNGPGDREQLGEVVDEGFTGSLAHELGVFGLRAKLVELGYAPTTRSGQNNEIAVQDLIPEAYAGFAQPIFAEFVSPAMTKKESDAAEAVWLAANDTSPRLHYSGGSDAVALAQVARTRIP